MFYSSMQELLKYVSTQFLRSVEITDKYHKEKRNKILNEGVNALSANKLVCSVIKAPSLFEAINMSLMNTLANTSKHSTLVFPYSEQYAEEIINTYNDYIESIWSSMGEEDIDEPVNNTEISQLVQDYLNGEASSLAIASAYDTFNDYEKLQIMIYLADKHNAECVDYKYKQIVNMGNNDWFVACDSYKKTYDCYCNIVVALLRRNDEFDNIKIVYNDCVKPQKYCSLGSCIQTEFELRDYDLKGGCITALNTENYRSANSKYIKFRTRKNSVSEFYASQYKD